MKKFILILVVITGVFIIGFSCAGCEAVDAFVEVTHTVSFNTNGGTAVGVIEASLINQPPTTSKEGYNFVGWYIDPNLITKAVFPMDINDNIVLYAKWVKKTYKVTFVTNGGTSVSSRTVSEINNSPGTSRSGYLFDGWYLDEGLNIKASFPMSVKSQMTLYAKWILLENTVKCTDSRIKYMDKSENDSVIYHITPIGFDLQTLSNLKYKMKITVTYDVCYKKDYDVFLDIGYLGSPKYEAAIYNSDKTGIYKYDLGTTKSGDTRTMTYTEYPINLIGDKITLEFSTDNVQNKIYFENIVVKYECIK